MCVVDGERGGNGSGAFPLWRREGLDASLRAPSRLLERRCARRRRSAAIAAAAAVAVAPVGDFADTGLGRGTGSACWCVCVVNTNPCGERDDGGDFFGLRDFGFASLDLFDLGSEISGRGSSEEDGGKTRSGGTFSPRCRLSLSILRRRATWEVGEGGSGGRKVEMVKVVVVLPGVLGSGSGMGESGARRGGASKKASQEDEES
jgi:hypothetical protein